MTDKDKKIPRDVQAGLDAYATYFMALAQLEKFRLENHGTAGWTAEEIARSGAQAGKNLTGVQSARAGGESLLQNA